ncbi:flagellar biosynthetic protein FliR [Kushneria aurantia]|uniref:Flagellar biosynthetic protein FliR n=1 Tax=Kushneria aurantia TaxID=504092 RepID=A0ABV6G153_9GAMM|nr:flagellar biosynthetic protein FliR [Kushneria aurantia]
MLEITYAQLNDWLTAFFWPFVRILAFIGVAPVFSDNAFSRPAKIGLAMVLTVVIAPIIPPMPDVPPTSWAGLMIVVQQFIIGAALGVVMSVVFAAIRASGEFIGLQMGLAFATFFSSSAGGSTTVLSRILYTFSMLLFLALDGHLVMIRLLAETFIRLPVGLEGLEAEGFMAIARWGSIIFSAGFLLGMPVITSLLIINLSMGILNRASPQFSIFSVGFPITLLTGVTLITFMTPELGNIFRRLFEMTFEQMVSVTELLAPPP